MVTTIRYDVNLPEDNIFGEHYMTICSSSSSCPPEYPWLETEEQNTCGGSMPCADCQPWANFWLTVNKYIWGIHLRNTFQEYTWKIHIRKKHLWGALPCAYCQPWSDFWHDLSFRCISQWAWYHSTCFSFHVLFHWNDKKGLQLEVQA